ncbi:hypothetical protein GCM10025868_19200 [Angustibacter aerolatus]|uniref:RNA polymerase sigma-70 region 4 domain-containing protein n=1 Tax=Angustibacter aerolatus TaxID=1162965 RepID=A0ABQ6JER9_9ACTN|nr:hypothetical protein GCM10025868_19200 [Angustibacter aerolatus]
MVRNRLIDRSRTRAFRLELVQPDMSTVGATAGGHSVLERVVVTDLVRRLSDKDRQVLIEVYLRDRSVEQTAEVLGLPSGTVRSRCFYALRRLRSMLDDEPEPAARRLATARHGTQQRQGRQGRVVARGEDVEPAGCADRAAVPGYRAAGADGAHQVAGRPVQSARGRRVGARVPRGDQQQARRPGRGRRPRGAARRDRAPRL